MCEALSVGTLGEKTDCSILSGCHASGTCFQHQHFSMFSAASAIKCWMPAEAAGGKPGAFPHPAAEQSKACQSK